MRDPFYNRGTYSSIIYRKIVGELTKFLYDLKKKYAGQLKKIDEVNENTQGFKRFELKKIIYDFIKNDPELNDIFTTSMKNRALEKKMVKQLFKDCFNEVLEETPIVDVNGEQVNPKTKKMLLAEKIVNDTLNGTIEPAVLKGLEIIRDTIGEKPANEVITKGIEQKILDINVDKEKVEKVKKLLESLRERKLIDGLGKNIEVRRSVEGLGNEGVIEVSVSRESERVHNADVLPDKQD